MGALGKELVRHIPAAKTFAGLLMCTAAASGFTEIFRKFGGSDAAPVLFLIVVGVVAWFFGTLAALLGLATGTVILAEFLYPPVEQLIIAAGSARINMAMMLLFGIAIAYFYGRQSTS